VKEPLVPRRRKAVVEHQVSLAVRDIVWVRIL
jgi:hypothetical protein